MIWLLFRGLGRNPYKNYVAFLGDLKTPKWHFEINWPLAMAAGSGGMLLRLACKISKRWSPKPALDPLAWSNSPYITIEWLKQREGLHRAGNIQFIRKCGGNRLPQLLRRLSSILTLWSRTTDAQRGNSLHCMTNHSLPCPNF